jgi:hypothetical protein
MTQLTRTTSFLKHSQPLLTKCLQAALIAAPVLLAAAPSEAVTVKATVDGFTGVFAPAQWSKDPTLATGGNSVTITGGSMTLRKNLANNPATVFAFTTLSEGLFDALRPTGGGRLLNWSATGLADWSLTGSSNNSRYNFSVAGKPTPATKINTAASVTNTPFSIGEDYSTTPFNSANPSEMRFSVAKVGAGNFTGVGTGVIDNFVFTAEYDVPGPLPVVGAAAAFAWSRRLRKRLNSAKTLA